MPVEIVYTGRNLLDPLTQLGLRRTTTLFSAAANTIQTPVRRAWTVSQHVQCRLPKLVAR